MIKYKLTDEKFQTRGGCQWGEGVTHEASGEGKLCGPGWIHVYDSPELAVLMNPIHQGFTNPVLWEVQASGKCLRNGDIESGYTKVTTLRRIPLPKVKLDQRVAFAIRCALALYREPSFIAWAKAWLSGEDRSSESARAAAEAAHVAGKFAYDYIDAYASYAAASAAYAAAYAMDAAYHALAATQAANAAANAAIVKNLNLKQIAKDALADGRETGGSS